MTISKETEWLARVGDGVLKAELSVMRRANSAQILYPVEFYLTNFYLSRVLIDTYNEYAQLKDASEHDLGTIFEARVGQLYESKGNVKEFLERVMFKKQHEFAKESLDRNLGLIRGVNKKGLSTLKINKHDGKK